MAEFLWAMNRLSSQIRQSNSAQQKWAQPQGAFMNQNVGLFDRGIRIIAGLALISQVFVGLHTPWGWIGVIPLATGVAGWCGLYTLLGIRTCRTSRQP